MANRNPIVLRCPVTAEERALIEQKMAIDGFITYTVTTDIKAFTSEMAAMGQNINQIAKRINATGPPIRRTWRKSGKGWTRYCSYKDASYQVNAEINASWKCGKLPLMPMENPFTAYGKGQAFPTGPQTGFPQQRLTWQFTHIPRTPTTAIIHPILSYLCFVGKGDMMG